MHTHRCIRNAIEVYINTIYVNKENCALNLIIIQIDLPPLMCTMLVCMQISGRYVIMQMRLVKRVLRYHLLPE